MPNANVPRRELSAIFESHVALAARIDTLLSSFSLRDVSLTFPSDDRGKNSTDLPNVYQINKAGFETRCVKVLRLQKFTVSLV